MCVTHVVGEPPLLVTQLIGDEAEILELEGAQREHRVCAGWTVQDLHLVLVNGGIGEGIWVDFE